MRAEKAVLTLEEILESVQPVTAQKIQSVGQAK
jgi:hypothetical protein